MWRVSLYVCVTIYLSMLYKKAAVQRRHLKLWVSPSVYRRLPALILCAARRLKKSSNSRDLQAYKWFVLSIVMLGTLWSSTFPFLRIFVCVFLWFLWKSHWRSECWVMSADVGVTVYRVISNTLWNTAGTDLPISIQMHLQLVNKIYNTAPRRRRNVQTFSKLFFWQLWLKKSTCT